MLAARTLLFSLALSVAAFSFTGCSALSGEEEDGEAEEEGFGETNDELRSQVACQERTETAYKDGTATTIQVVNIGGKPIAKPAGHAFLKLQAAAHAAGVRLSLTSGFRTQAEQTHLYNCYQTKSCNNGNLAAKPGFSRHQSGVAVDLAMTGWTARNAARFGFVATVPQEPWHFEFRGKDPGGPCSRNDGTDDEDRDGGGATPRDRGVTWVAPLQNSVMKNGFTVKAHANRPGIVKMVYSQGTFEFGTSTDVNEDFALTYKFIYMGDKTLTAKGYDASGLLLGTDYVDFTLLP